MEYDKFYKTLSKNDTGETNSHQSGITISKYVASCGVFPIMGIEDLNPRVEVVFYDDNDIAWKFMYIYYNDIFHGKGSKRGHNEYRLTYTNSFIKNYNLKSGDSVWFSIDENGIRHIGYEKKETLDSNKTDGIVTLTLKSGWRCVKM